MIQDGSTVNVHYTGRLTDGESININKYDKKG